MRAHDMARREPPRPTEAELAILRVLWSEGPCTVRTIQQVMSREQPTGYTTVLKLLQIMTGKGLVVRDESKRSHVYRASRHEARTQKQLVGDLLDRAFGGSAARLVMQGAHDAAGVGGGAGGNPVIDRANRAKARG